MKAIALGLKERPKFKPARGLKGPAWKSSVNLCWYRSRGLPSPSAACIPPWGELEKPIFASLSCLAMVSSPPSCPPTKCPDPSAYASWQFLHVGHMPSAVRPSWGGGRLGGDTRKIAPWSRPRPAHEDNKITVLSPLLAPTQPWGACVSLPSPS